MILQQSDCRDQNENPDVFDEAMLEMYKSVKKKTTLLTNSFSYRYYVFS